MKVGSVAPISLLLIIFLPAPASAVGTVFGQKILPVDCVFETVNDGTGTVHFLTPAACGVLIPQILAPTDIAGELKRVNVSAPFAPIASPAAASTMHSAAGSAAAGLPWQPVVTRNSAPAAGAVTSTAHVPTGVAAVAITISVTAIVLLLALVL